jgi:multidrug efflux pump subunit AcrB
MTLGGLALAVGILVDDATVTIENIDRNLEDGPRLLHEAILDGAGRSPSRRWSRPSASASCLLPMFFLGGVARYLFVPLAEAVVFAMLASYVLSRTLVPTLAMYLLKAKGHTFDLQNPLVRFQRGFERPLRAGPHGLRRPPRRGGREWPQALHPAPSSSPAGSCFALVPFLGQDFFPDR